MTAPIIHLGTTRMVVTSSQLVTAQSTPTKAEPYPAPFQYTAITVRPETPEEVARWLNR